MSDVCEGGFAQGGAGLPFVISDALSAYVAGAWGEFPVVDHRAAIASEVAKAARRAERSYKNEHPEAARIGVVATIGAFKHRPKDFAGYETRAVALFLSDRSSLDRSNSDIAAYLSEGIPGYIAPVNLLTEKLRAKAKEKVKKLLVERGINLRDEHLISLSKIKHALRALYTGDDEGSSFNVRVTFTSDTVIVGARHYPIQTSGCHRRIHVGKAMLNVEGLKMLLSSCSSPSFLKK